MRFSITQHSKDKISKKKTHADMIRVAISKQNPRSSHKQQEPSLRSATKKCRNAAFPLHINKNTDQNDDKKTRCSSSFV